VAINYTAVTSTTQGTAALALADLVTKLTAAITANPAWTLEASIGPLGTGNWNYRVFKNSAAGSGLGSDYRFTIAYNATTLYSIVSEGFATTGTNQFKTLFVTSGTATGGTYSITVNGQTTTPLGYNSNAATIQTVVASLSGVGTGNCLAYGANVASNPGIDLMFTRGMSGYQNPTVTVNSSLTGTSPVLTASNMTNVWTSLTPAFTMAAWIDGNGQFTDTALTTDINTAGSWAVRGITNQAIGLPPNAMAGMYVTAASATTYYYTAVVYSDHLVLGFGPTSAANLQFYYFGGTTPFAAVSDPLAVGSFSLTFPNSGSTWTGGGFTRALAPFFSQGTATWVTAARGTSTVPLDSRDFEYYAASYAYANRDTPQSQLTGKYYMSRVSVPQALTTNTISIYTATEPRAFFNNLVGSNCRPPSIVVGDTIVFNGTQWMCIYTSAAANNFYVDTGAP
jgi:hypothetical protein